MNFDVYTFGGGAYYQEIFNGVAAIMGSGDYMTLLKMGLMVGLLAVLIRAGYKGTLIDFPWFIYSMLLFYAAFIPKANVIITDRVDPSQSSVVQHVPLGLAATAGIANSIGYWLATEFDSTFSLPNDLDYSQHGLLFGNSLIDAASHFEINDPRLAGNMSEFWQQCVFYDILLHLYTMTDLSTAPDMWSFIKGHTSVARAFSYTPATGPAQILVCRTGANNQLDQDLNNDLPQLYQLYGTQLVRASTTQQAVSQFQAALPTAYSYLANVSDSAKQIMMQNVLANSMQRGVQEWAARAGAPAAAVAYGLARAEQERRSTYTVLGALAEKMLPIVQSLIEAAVYAIFPLIFVGMLMPGGGMVVIAYLRILAWITLWNPLYAILHLAITVFSRIAAGNYSMLADGTHALTMSTYTGLGHVMSDYAIFAAYLSLSIPVIAYYLVAGGGAVLASATSRITGGFEGPAAQASNEATSGNIGLGNNQIGNASWNQIKQAPSMLRGFGTETGADGIQYQHTSDGIYASVPSSQIPISPSISNQIASSVSRQASQSLREAQTQTNAWSSAEQATFGSMQALAQRVSQDTGYAKQFDGGTTDRFQQDYGQLQHLVHTFAEQHQESFSEAFSQLYEATVRATFGGAVSAGKTASASAGIGSSMSEGSRDTNTHQTSDLEQQANQFARDYHMADLLASTQQAASSMLSTYKGTVDTGSIHQTQSQLAETAELRKGAQASLERAGAYQRLQQRMETEGAGFQTSMATAFVGFIAGYSGGSTAAAAELIAQANRGDEGAMTRVNGFANAFLQQDLVKLAGVADAPTPQGLNAQFDADSGNITRTGAGTVLSVHADGDGATTPPPGVGLTPGEVDKTAGDNASGVVTVQVQRQEELDRERNNGESVFAHPPQAHQEPEPEAQRKAEQEQRDKVLRDLGQK
jgi:TraG-like protein, N-terminal region.